MQTQGLLSIKVEYKKLKDKVNQEFPYYIRLVGVDCVSTHITRFISLWRIVVITLTKLTSQNTGGFSNAFRRFAGTSFRQYRLFYDINLVIHIIHSALFLLYTIL
jgi:hypothetical protein